MPEQGSNRARPQTQPKHPDEWQRDLNPDQSAGQNIGPTSDHDTFAATAFHLRKRGRTLRGLDDNDLKQIPLLADGERLQQGATYANLADDAPAEFTATGDMTTRPGDAYAPKDKIPYEVWNRLIGEPKPGQERS